MGKLKRIQLDWARDGKEQKATDSKFQGCRGQGHHYLFVCSGLKGARWLDLRQLPEPDQHRKASLHLQNSLGGFQVPSQSRLRLHETSGRV